MSQPRVTDFFAQRKKGGVDGIRRGKEKTSAAGRKTKATITAAATRSLRSAKSSIHEEFIRVIDEATAVSPGAAISPPRTPKRTTTDAEFDLGAALFCSTAEHSSTKKKVRVEVGNRDKDADPGVKVRKKTSRKRLILVCILCNVCRVTQVRTIMKSMRENRTACFDGSPM